MSTDPHERLAELLATFNAPGLGEGDTVAGANLLAAMACALANLSRPGSGLVAGDGTMMRVGCSLLVAGGHAVNQGLLGLAYHGWGFNAGIAREEVVKLLACIRANGSISRRHLQRRVPAHSAEVSDKVLDRLAAENLVHLEANQVTALPLADFIRSLPSRPGFPVPHRMTPEFLNQWDPALAG